jgi:D-alanyl-D-alanine carboxypeptidase (penicillin-binding protein 5/6)
MTSRPPLFALSALWLLGATAADAATHARNHARPAASAPTHANRASPTRKVTTQAGSRPAPKTMAAPTFALATPGPGSAVPDAPTIDARTWAVIDAATGTLLAESNGAQRGEPASLTKLMTSYVVFQALHEGRLKLSDPVMISEHAWRAEGSRSFVQVGTSVPVDTLVKGMIVQSGNDAAIALAERVGGSEPAFVQLMNSTAQRLGMSDTHFNDASGLPSEGHYTTARDLATLSRAIIHDYPEYYGLYSLRDFTWGNIRQDNRNGLLERDASVDGLKTGHTDSAGYCLVTSAKRDGMRLVSVVLGASSVKAREDGSAALLAYGFSFYETVTVRQRGATILTPRVYKGAETTIAIGPDQDVQLTVPRGQGTTIGTRASAHLPLLAPLAPGIAVGELEVSSGGKSVAKFPLYPAHAVAVGGLWRRLIDTISLWF